MDFATLTGAQLVCTGNKHAAIMSNEEDFERLVKQSGHKCGDWVHPIVYAPELLMSQFESQVADMKNSGALSLYSIARLWNIDAHVLG